MFFTEQLLSLSHLYLFPSLSGLAQYATLLSCNLKPVVIISHSFHGQKYFYIDKRFLQLNICNLFMCRYFSTVLSFFLSCFAFINSRVKQPGKPKLWNHIKPGSLVFAPGNFRLVCHPYILLTMATELKKMKESLKQFALINCP